MDALDGTHSAYTNLTSDDPDALSPNNHNQHERVPAAGAKKRYSKQRWAPFEIELTSPVNYFSSFRQSLKPADSETPDSPGSPPGYFSRLISPLTPRHSRHPPPEYTPTFPTGFSPLVSKFYEQKEPMEKPLPYPPKSKYKPWKRRPSWQRTLWWALMAAISVLAINGGFLVLVWAKFGWYQKDPEALKFGKDGHPEVLKGDCKDTKSQSLWLHMFINLASSCLLGASNYTMQILSAPSRRDVDKAHNEWDWLNVGVSGLRNVRFRRIGGTRVLLWWLLFFSSVPLHLLYNSVIYTSVATNDYELLLLSQASFDGLMDPNMPDSLRAELPEWMPFDDPTRPNKDVAEVFTTYWNTYKRLSPEECIHAYAKLMQSDYEDLYIITNNTEYHRINHSSVSFTDIAIDQYNMPGYFAWMFNLTDDAEVNRGIAAQRKAREMPDHSLERLLSIKPWKVFGQPVEYCLAEPSTVTGCSLQFHMIAMIVVVLCNIVKCVCIWIAIYRIREQPLVNLGDAVSSFLTNPDPTTRGMCLSNRYDYEMKICKRCKERDLRWVPLASPRAFVAKQYRWWEAPSKSSWWLAILGSIACIIGVGVFYAHAVTGIALSQSHDEMFTHTSLKDLWDIGFGSVYHASMADIDRKYYSMPKSETGNIILANIPQMVISYLYLVYNDLFTRMLEGAEWASYSAMSGRARGLRVSEPVPGSAQWSRPYLQLPIRYSAPLMLYSFLMHWIISQMLFFVNIQAFVDGMATIRHATIGWSAIVMVFVMMAVAVLLLVTIAFGFRKYPKGMPLVGSCSAAISAASHHFDGEDLARKKIQWGEVWQWREARQPAEWHCSFAEELAAPKQGRFYS